MKHLWIIGSLLLLLTATGCGDRPERITDEPLKQEEETEQDTTLQDVEEVTIRISGGEDLQSMDFDRDTIEVKAGSLVKLSLVNEGKDPKMIYNVVFTREGYSAQAARKGSKAGASGNYLPDSSMMLAASPLALPGQTVNMEFTAPSDTGVYEYVNTYPSDSKEMKGKLVIK